MDAKEKAIRQRLKDDFAHYSARCLKLVTKDGTIEPFVLNEAQRFIHERLEEQLARTGKIRSLILKGRQQGCSTYVEGRFYWKVSHRMGARAFILTHLDDATSNVFAMAKRYHENCPDLVKPSTKSSNAKELLFDRLDSGYKVGTAGSKGVGRSSTIQFFHGSEVAYWPHAQTHFAGVMQAIPNAPGTEVILESTSDGPHGLFYELCIDAYKSIGDYQLIFVPWFWQSEYRTPVPEGFEPTSEEQEYAETHGIDLEQIAWRRAKIVELRGVEHFRREYPATVEEAFTSDAEHALWKRDQLNALRVPEAPDMVRVVVGVDPAATNNERSDETGVIIAGIGVDGMAYVIEDASLKSSPDGWGWKVVSAYHKHGADRIVPEVNNGGDMVTFVLQTVDPNISIKPVRASRGKLTRAEPIASLYEQGKVRHVGHFPALENQMCTWVPGSPSPDRLDALVWALTDLMLGGGQFSYA